MDLRFIFFACCLVVPVYSSYERFIGKTRHKIECKMDSYIVTNHENYTTDCNGKKMCNNTNELSFVCLKEQYQVSKCKRLKKNRENVTLHGCYVTVKEHKIGVTIQPIENNITHIFLLNSSMVVHRNGLHNYTAFSHLTCKDTCYVTFDEDSWFLLKYSNNENEDFEEFFVDINQEAIPETIPERKIEILVAIVVILTVVMVVMCLVFLRKRFQNSKKTLNAKLTNDEFPLRGNMTINPGSHENTSMTEDHELYAHNVLYGTTQSEFQFQQKAEAPLEEQQSAQILETINAEINHGEGLKNDSASGGSRHVVVDRYSATGDPHHVIINGELYATVDKEEESNYVNSCHSDDLIREEVDGEMYTFIKREGAYKQ